MGRHCEGRGRDGEREFPGAHAEDLHRQRALVSGPFVFSVSSPGCDRLVYGKLSKTGSVGPLGLLRFVLHAKGRTSFNSAVVFPALF